MLKIKVTLQVPDAFIDSLPGIFTEEQIKKAYSLYIREKTLGPAEYYARIDYEIFFGEFMMNEEWCYGEEVKQELKEILDL